MRHEHADSACDEECLRLSSTEAAHWADIFKTLGDPVRLRLLMHLAAQHGAEVPVHEICDVGVSQPTVSHHLKRLKCAGLVECRREGRIVYYRMTDEVRHTLMQIVHPSAHATVE